MAKHWTPTLVSISRKSYRLASVAVLLGSLHAFGCDEEEVIRRHTIPKYAAYYDANHVPAKPQDEQQQPVAEIDRMLGAVVPMGDRTWFFKMVGDKDEVTEEGVRFVEFVRSLRFPDQDRREPTWTLPEGWQTAPASASAMGQMRFATIRIGKSIELTVTPLPTSQGNPEDSMLANVNRWRRQLQLPAVNKVELRKMVEQLELEDGVATLINLVGDLGPARGSRGGMGSSFGPAPRPTERAQTEAVPKFRVPTGWEPGKSGGIRTAAFDVRDGENHVEVTVIRLPASGLLANVNRWRDQVQLAAVSEEQLQKDLKQLRVGDRSAKYVELLGPEDADRREAILGAILEEDSTAWFIKLRGDAELAMREKSKFEQFVESLRFPTTADGENDG